MSGRKKALLDSNTIIYLAQNSIQTAFLNNYSSLGISMITYMEVLGYADNSKKEESLIKELLNVCDLVEIDMDIAERVIVLRKIHKIKLPDAIIYASAELTNSDLVSLDKGFEKIRGKAKLVTPEVST